MNTNHHLLLVCCKNNPVIDAIKPLFDKHHIMLDQVETAQEAAGVLNEINVNFILLHMTETTYTQDIELALQIRRHHASKACAPCGYILLREEYA